jgi:hypothetical protein
MLALANLAVQSAECATAPDVGSDVGGGALVELAGQPVTESNTGR